MATPYPLRRTPYSFLARRARRPSRKIALSPRRRLKNRGSDQEDDNKGHENAHVTEATTKKSEKRLKEKARKQRALKTISLREEEEKLNVWDAVKKVFQRAVQYCDRKEVHLVLLAMYERTEQYQLADEELDGITKSFKTSCKIWLCRIQLALKQGKDVEYIKSIINRALLCLPQRKRIKFVSQTAILEFKCEFLFTKYLKYEQSQGDKEREVYVKQKAMEYVQTSLPT
ncbi:hypothetical protein PR202_ga27995 [Eleusine coracana subsp. coracana]|uniref:Uncharacterized protein n=1 Tax=Eleusine coracana subsp. coracana TaxID=191504 RepID=A0AAV5DJ43_ELECO|nr:hypothetical protein PR202_ga27995 [Eleusine coracana subsp. coracana]